MRLIKCFTYISPLSEAFLGSYLCQRGRVNHKRDNGGQHLSVTSNSCCLQVEQPSMEGLQRSQPSLKHTMKLEMFKGENIK